MRVHNFTYKGLNFGDSQAEINNFAVQNVFYGLNYTTQVFDKTTGHGAYSTNTLAGGRQITISGTIFGTTRLDRWNGQQKLQSIIIPEFYLETTTRGFYEYTFTNDEGTVLKGMAKVTSDIRYEDTLDSPLIGFSFDILSEDPTFKGLNQKNASGFDGFIGGTVLGTTLGVALDEVIGELTIENIGNRQAPCYINVLGNLDNPVIKNVTSGREYGVLKSTTNFVFDNTGEDVVVTDAGVNVKGLRKPGSKLIYLNPGVNKIILTADNNYILSSVTFSIIWNDTYIN